MQVNPLPHHLHRSELTPSLHLLQALMSSSNDALIAKDAEGRYVFCNEIAAQYLGKSIEQILGKSDVALFDRETAAAIEAQDRRIFSTGFTETEDQYITIDGTPRIFEVKKSAYRDGQNNIIGVIGVVRDVTEPRKTEERLRESHRQLTSIYEAVGDVIFLIDVTNDSEFRFRSVNPTFLTCTQLPLDSVLGKRIEEVIPEPSCSIVLNNYRRAIAEKCTVRWDETTTYPSGTRVGGVTVVPVFSDDGKCVHLVGSVHDVSDRKAIEDALRESEQRLAEAQKIAKSGSWTWESKSGKASWSDGIYILFGLERDAVQPCLDSFLSVVHPDDHQIVRARIDAMHMGINDASEDFRIIRPDGTLVWIQSRAKATREESGRILRIEGTDQDVTEQKRAELALRESERRLQIALRAANAVAFVWDAETDLITRNLDPDSKLPSTFMGPESIDVVRTRIHPDDIERFNSNIVACLRGGTQYRNLYRELRPESSFVWLEEWGHLERHDDGSPNKLMGVAFDVTQRKQAEAELHQMGELLRAIAEGTTDAIFVKDRIGKYIFFNEAAARFVGKPIDQVLGKDDTNLFDTHGAKHVMERDRRIMQLGQIETEIETLTAAGISRTYHATKGPYRDKAGNILGVIGISRDMTDQIRAESERIDSAERYRLAVLATNDAVWDVDATSGIVSWNDQYTTTFGRPPETTNSWEWWIEHIHADDRDRTSQSLRSAIDGSDHYWSCDYRFRRVDGVWADIRDRAYISRDDVGRPRRIVGTMQDLTDRNLSEQALAISEERSRLAREAGQIGIFDWNAASNCSHWTVEQEAIYGIAPGDYSGEYKEWIERIHPQDRALVRETLDTAIASMQESVEHEYRIIRPDGATRWVRSRGRLTFTEEGALKRLIGTSIDMTEAKQAVESLRINEERYRSLVAALAEGIVVQSADGEILTSNQSAERILGLTNDQLCGRTSLDSSWCTIHEDGSPFPGEDHPAMVTLRTGRPCSNVMMGVRKANEEFAWISINAEPLFHPGENAPYGVVCSFTDATERKLAETALRENQRFLNAIFQATPDCIKILDQSGGIIEMNAAGLAMIDAESPEIVMGGCAYDLIAPSDRLRFEKFHQRVCDGQSGSLDFDVIGFRGRRVSMESHSVPVDINGQRLHLSVTRDVTERKRTEEDLNRLWQNAVDPVCIASFDGYFKKINPAWLRCLGWPEEDLLSRPWMDFVHPDDHDQTIVATRKLTEGESINNFENRYRCRNGSYRWFSWNAIPGIKSQEFYGFVRDITERKRLENQFQQSQKMEAVGRLAGGIAHDFNNLLTIINGYGNLVLSEIPLESTQRESLVAILEAGDRAARLTQQLLAFSRKAIVDPKVLDLNEIVGRTASMLRRLVEEDIMLIVDCDPDLPNIVAAPGQLEQILMNMVVNARDAMPEGGELFIRTRKVAVSSDDIAIHPDLTPGDYVELTVADTGNGMTDEIKEMIFEPFFTTKDVGKGTGLGLSVVHGVVTQCGGTITVESKLHFGTTFEILFPAAASKLLSTESGTGRQSTQGTETILLVEDEDAVRKIVRIGLERKGYTVLEADRGAKALQIADDFPGKIDMLLADVVMPEMGGQELAVSIRKRQPGIHVLFMSGYTDDAVLQRGITNENERLLQKPFTAAALTRKVRSILDESP